MSQPHGAPTLGWVPAWSNLQGRSAHPTDAGFVLDTWPGQDGEGQEYVVGWPAPGSDELPATYDAVEITVFDHPVAKGRIQIRDGVAAVAITEVPAGPDEATFTRALFAAMAEEAFLHGAEDLYMVVEPGEAAAYEESGWARAGRLVSFEKE